MKVAIGSNIINGPWGGGNLFSKSLRDYLIKNNVSVCNNLITNDIDIILLTEPRIESSTSTITLIESLMYKKFVNKNVKIVHRVNECDERKNTNYVNKKMLNISNKVDFTIFVSSWIYGIYKKIGFKKESFKIVLSGSDKTIFNKNGKNVWDGTGRLKIVTHHWGNNWNKGFDIYSHIDKLLENSKFKERYEFTYIGNIPTDFLFKNTKLIKPLNGLELAETLKQNDLYITGSLNEPSGNHQIEASLCGLPVLYLNSGGIPEYQTGYGTEYNKKNLEIVLKNIYENYKYHFKKNKSFPFNAEIMCEEYLSIFTSIFKNNNNKKFSIYLSIYRFLHTVKINGFIKKTIAYIIYHLRKVKK